MNSEGVILNDELKILEKEAEELRQNLWVWKGISFLFSWFSILVN